MGRWLSSSRVRSIRLVAARHAKGSLRLGAEQTAAGFESAVRAFVSNEFLDAPDGAE